jgi:hypothetical protein
MKKNSTCVHYFHIPTICIVKKQMDHIKNCGDKAVLKDETPASYIIPNPGLCFQSVPDYYSVPNKKKT